MGKAIFRISFPKYIHPRKRYKRLDKAAVFRIHHSKNRLPAGRLNSDHIFGMGYGTKQKHPLL